MFINGWRFFPKSLGHIDRWISAPQDFFISADTWGVWCGKYGEGVTLVAVCASAECRCSTNLLIEAVNRHLQSGRFDEARRRAIPFGLMGNLDREREILQAALEQIVKEAEDAVGVLPCGRRDIRPVVLPVADDRDP